MPDRRGFLGAVTALVAAPWVPRPTHQVERVANDLGHYIEWLTDPLPLPECPPGQIFFLGSRMFVFGQRSTHEIIQLPKPVGVIRNLAVDEPEVRGPSPNLLILDEVHEWPGSE